MTIIPTTSIRDKNGLTPCHIEVLKLICEGLTTKEIAAKLFRSAKTIENHRDAIHKVSGKHNVAAVAIWAVRHGYVDVGNH